MNKRILLVLFAGVFYTMSFAQEVPQQQRSLITKVTATWCPHCGNWGWTFMENLIEDNADKAIIISAGASGDLQTPEGSALASNFNASGQPVFILNNSNIGATSGNASSKRTEVRNQVNANFEMSPVVNTGIAARMPSAGGNELVINTKTRFFQDTEGDYYLSVYVMEDDVEANQAGNVTDNMHPRVIRQSLNGNFGESIANGTVSAGMEVLKEYSLTINPDWDTNNLRIMAMMWRKNGTAYEFVNGYDAHVLTLVKTTNLDATSIKFQIAPTVIDHQAIIAFETATTQAAHIRLFDTNGRLVETLFEGKLPQGQQQFALARQAYTGVYFVQIQLDGKSLTKRVVFR